MIHALRRRSALVVITIVVLAGGFARWLSTPPAAQRSGAAGALARQVDFSMQSTAAAAEPDGTDGVRIEYRAQIGELYYYVIENEIIDDVAIYTQQFRLPSTTTFRDRRTIVQSVVPAAAPATQPVRKNLPPLPPPTKNEAVMRFEWVVDRYDAREKVTDMKEVTFDSLKDTYPMRELSGLARVLQSRAAFNFDGKTGAVSALVVTPGPNSHPSDNRQSKTAERGLVTPENMQELLYAMGEQFLPNAPKRVGDQWTIQRIKPTAPFGTVTTDTTCTLKSIQKSGDADIALIDLVGVIHFDPTPVKAPPAPAIVGPPATTRPVTSAPRYPAAPPPVRRTPATRPAVRFQPPPKHTTTRPTPTPTRPPQPTPPMAEHFPLPQVDAAPPTGSGDPAATSMPVPMPTSMPASQPAAAPPSKNSEDPFKMEKALFKGTVKFDVTHGRLVELNMVRNGSFVKVMRSDKEEMKIKQGSAHTLRIKGSVTPPPRPNIPGGPKPPVETPNPNGRTVTPTTTRPASHASTQPGMHGTTQPASIRAATTQRIATTSPAFPGARGGVLPQPVGSRVPSNVRGVTPTSQPTKTPAPPAERS